MVIIIVVVGVQGGEITMLLLHLEWASIDSKYSRWKEQVVLIMIQLDLFHLITLNFTYERVVNENANNSVIQFIL